MNTTASRVAFGSCPRRPSLALYALAPLLVLGCTARTPLGALSGSSSEPGDGVDTGGEPGVVVGGAGSGGGNVAGAPGRGGAVATGGSVATSGGRVSGGASGSFGGAMRNGGGTASSGGISNSSGGISVVGGITTRPSGGRTAAGGATSTVGGATPARGGSPAGGTTATGNATAAGGRSAAGGSVATGGTLVPGAPLIQPDGYVALNTGMVVMAGHISSYESGSGSSITLSYAANSFCASGTVAADSTYSSWAGAGFNVNQAQSGASGSSGSLVLTGSTISVNYVNHAGSTLEFQLYDGSDYWCAYLAASTSPTVATIPFSRLNTQCWNGGGSSFTSGTPITAVQIMVPGSATVPTPFDFCFLGLTVQ